MDTEMIEQTRQVYLTVEELTLLKQLLLPPTMNN